MGIKVGRGASDTTRQLTFNLIESKVARNEKDVYDGAPTEFDVIEAVATYRLV